MQTYSKTQRILRIAGVLGLLFPMSAYAQMSEIFPEGTLTGIANFASYAIMIMDILTWMLFVILQFLLDPQFIFNMGSTGNAFMTMLNEIWRLSRDLMNIAFAVILIGTAVYMVVKADKGEVMAHAPKFIMSVIFVNFSWFAPLLIIDVANITAATIYGIPSLLVSNPASKCEFPSTKNLPGYTCGPTTPPKADRYMCNCKVVTNAQFLIDDEAQYNALKGAGALGWRCFGPLLCIQTRDLSSVTISGHSTILNGLVVNHGRLQQLATVPTTTAGGPVGPKTLLTFVMRQLIILIIHAALLFPLLAMVVAFTIRIPILWLTMAFMPFVFLKFVMQNSFAEEIYDKIWKNFTRAAFLPAIVAIPLSVGFILVNAGARMVSAPGTSMLDGITIKLIDGIGSFWELLWLCLTLGVMWVGTFSMLEKMGPMAFGSMAIKNFGQAVGKIALKAPLSAPILPLPGGGTGSVKDVMSRTGLSDKFKDILNAKPSSWASQEKYRGGGAIIKESVDVQNKLNANIEKLAQAMESGTVTQRSEALKGLKGAFVDAKIELPQDLTEGNAAEQVKNIAKYANGTIKSELVKKLEEAAKKAADAAAAGGATR